MSKRLAVLCLVVAGVSGCGTPNPMAGAGGGGGSNGPATYYKDVLPITQVSCNGCHTTGGIAPFALDSYEAAKTKAPVMADAVKNKRMPPWPASKTCGGPFDGDRTLTDAQIATIDNWFLDGAQEGNPADAPPPVNTASDQLPRVDLEKGMTAAYTPTLKDDYRCFIVDPALTAQKVVTGYDITPGSKKVVHHVILYIVNRNDAVAKDAQDTKAGWECFGGADVDTTGTLGAWAPGGAAVLYPRNTGIRIGPNSVLAMQVHYNTENAVEPDQTSVKLMFGTGSEQSAYLLPIVADGFNIPPNAQGYQHVEDINNVLGFDLKLWGFLPHMHTKGKRITMTAGSDDQCLVDIPEWDFHWQTQYFRKTAYTLPRTGKLTMKCTWDNPTNSNVRWGEGTSDEMCFAFVYATL